MIQSVSDFEEFWNDSEQLADSASVLIKSGGVVMLIGAVVGACIDILLGIVSGIGLFEIALIPGAIVAGVGICCYVQSERVWARSEPQRTLRRLAAYRGVLISEVERDAVEEYVERHGDVFEEED